jgi:hypothetical protein
MLHRLSTKSHAQQKPKYPSEMSEIQWPHILYISLNQKKPDGLVYQTGGSGLGRWALTASFQYRMFWFLLASFQRLVFRGTSIKAFPSLLWRLLVPPTKYTHPKPLWALPNPSLWESCDLWENLSGGLRESSLWALEHLSFMKQSLWHLLLLEVKPPIWLGITLELSMLWWDVRKFVKVRFAYERKEARASEVRKAVERESAWS